MKTITILSAILFLSLNTLSVDSSSKCMVKLTKNDLLAEAIELHCANFNNNDPFTIKGFTIKFPGRPAEIIVGGQLNLKAKSYVSDLKVNQIVTVFEIKRAYSNGVLIASNEIPSFYINIID